MLEIGRQDRPSLYDLARDRPPPLVPRELRFGVPERMGPGGELAPLDEEALARAIESIRDSDVESVAVCLLFAFLHDEHERRVEETLTAALPRPARVAIERGPAGVPGVRALLDDGRRRVSGAPAGRLPRTSSARRPAGLGLPAPLVMQSSGGVVGIDQAASQAAACLLSGPAGGVVGAAYAAAASGYRDVLTFDMGGTSTDVAAVRDGEVLTTTETVVAGVPIKLPMVDVHTVSAGGGSIGWVDAGGALRAGPHSAGAEPGPAAYGRGGREPTVTDANLAARVPGGRPRARRRDHPQPRRRRAGAARGGRSDSA